jgi:hypothetical protein
MLRPGRRHSMLEQYINSFQKVCYSAPFYWFSEKHSSHRHIVLRICGPHVSHYAFDCTNDC